MKKKMLSLTLAIVLLVSLLPVASVPVTAMVAEKMVTGTESSFTCRLNEDGSIVKHEAEKHKAIGLMAWVFEELPPLSTPTGLEWSAEIPGFISWNAVPEAEGEYIITLYKDGAYFQESWWSGILGSGRVSVDIYSGEIFESGTYTFTIQARGDNINNSDSAVSETSAGFTYVRPGAVLAAPEEVAWDAENPTVATWSAVPGAAGYYVQLYCDGYPAGGVWSYWPEFTSEDFYRDMHHAGTYTFRARALSGNICKIANGEFSDLSAAYNLTGVNEKMKELFEELTHGDISAGEALEVVKGLNLYELAVSMQSDMDVLNAVTMLEERYAADNDIGIAIRVADGIDTLIDTGKVTIVGAALNAAESDITMHLNFSKPSEEVVVDPSQYKNWVQLNIELDGISDPTGDLDVPVRITMPLPIGVSPSRFCILHYHADGMYETIWPLINGDGTISFTLTSFSAFVFANEFIPTVTFSTNDLDGVLTQDEVITQLAAAGMGENDLFEAVLDESVTRIGDVAFYGCNGLTNVFIPGSVTEIGDLAFAYCYYLTGVVIPDSVMTIGWAAFDSCGITSVTISQSVTNIGTSAFGFCDNLMEINVSFDNAQYFSLDGVLFNKDKSTLLQYPGGKSGAYIIPDSVTSLANGSFDGCYGLSSVLIPDGVEDVGISPFSYSNITEILVVPENNDYASESGVLFNKAKTSLVQYPIGRSGSYIIPDGVTSIDGESFMDCRSLTSIIIPDSVTGIGPNAFLGCTSLTSVIIPSSVMGIGWDAFSVCTSLSEVYFNGDAPEASENPFRIEVEATAYVYQSAKGFPAEGEFWNGLTIKYRDDVRITMFNTGAISNLVSGYAANLPVNVTGDNLAGREIVFKLKNSGGETVYTSGPLAAADNFSATLKLDKDTLVLPAGNYTLEASVGDVTASTTVDIVELGNDIWLAEAVVVNYNGADTLTVRFAETPFTQLFTGSVTVDGVKFTNPVYDGNSIYLPGVDFTKNHTIKISGVKYPDLFPSYSFMFTVEVK